MPRSIIGANSQTKAEANRAISQSMSVPHAATILGARLEQRLRQKRSKSYVEGCRRLDAGTHHHNQDALDTLLESIGAEFPELTIDQRPIGLVSRCYLGAPYVVHYCHIAGNIVEHFESSRPMPAQFERARSLANHSAYAFIEVYSDSLRAVAADGSVSVINE